MGIYVRLKSQRGERVPLRDAPLIRLHYANEIIRYFYEGFAFVPENIEVWHNFPSESLGGKLEPYMTKKISDPFRDIDLLRIQLEKYPLDRLLSTIIVINGVWDLDGLKLTGFLSVNNNSAWRRVYRDIEFDAYGKGDVEDLVDALWKRDDTSEIVSKFISRLSKLKKGQPLVPHRVFFSVGVPVNGETENVRAIHLQDKRDLIDFFYSTLSEFGDPEIKEKMPPLDRAFFISAIADHETVKRRLTEALKNTVIQEISGNSVTYIAKEPNSFTRLYEQFSDAVFKPAMKNLPKTKDVKKIIISGLEKMKPLG
jgi:hypothetical protein